MKPEILSKLNFSVILNHLPTGRDIITGTLPGTERLEIKISRKFTAWTPLLRITVAGHTIHSGEATKSDQEQFNELANRAKEYQVNGTSPEHALETAKAAQLWIDSFK